MQQNHPQCLLNTIHYFKENELADYQLTNRQEYEWLRTLLHRPSLLSDLRPDFCEPVSVGLSLIHGTWIYRSKIAGVLSADLCN